MSIFYLNSWVPAVYGEFFFMTILIIGILVSRASSGVQRSTIIITENNSEGKSVKKKKLNTLSLIILIVKHKMSQEIVIQFPIRINNICAYFFFQG